MKAMKIIGAILAAIPIGATLLFGTGILVYCAIEVWSDIFAKLAR